MFSNNCDRLPENGIAAACMDAMLNLPLPKALRRKDGKDEPPALWRNGERSLRNKTRAPTTDLDARSSTTIKSGIAGFCVCCVGLRLEPVQ